MNENYTKAFQILAELRRIFERAGHGKKNCIKYRDYLQYGEETKLRKEYIL